MAISFMKSALSGTLWTKIVDMASYLYIILVNVVCQIHLWLTSTSVKFDFKHLSVDYLSWLELHTLFNYCLLPAILYV